MSEASIHQILLPWIAVLAVVALALTAAVLAVAADGKRQKAKERQTLDR